MQTRHAAWAALAYLALAMAWAAPASLDPAGSLPDYGDPVPIYAKEIPVFWGCGVTPQAVAVKARVELMITHEPAQMFLTDLLREGERRS